MGIFGPKLLPTTSYGYQPPAGATALGSMPRSTDCGFSEHEPVRRWPKSCSRCGSPADPLLNKPWKHDARGVELQWLIRDHPERGGGFNQDQWEVWQFKDSYLRGDIAGANRIRKRNRKSPPDPMEMPGENYFYFVWNALEAGDLDGAADELCYWMSVSSTEDVENDNTNRTNCRQVVDMTQRFFKAPGGHSHPRAPEIRRSCVKLAEEGFQVLNREQQTAVEQMARF